MSANVFHDAVSSFTVFNLGLPGITMSLCDYCYQNFLQLYRQSSLSSFSASSTFLGQHLIGKTAKLALALAVGGFTCNLALAEPAPNATTIAADLINAEHPNYNEKELRAAGFEEYAYDDKKGIKKLSKEEREAFAERIAADEERKLYILNWSDFIDPQILDDFEAETGIEVHYELMTSNEILLAKLLVSHSGYDIIAPSIHVLKHLADVDVLYPLDKKQLPNLKHLDQHKMQKIAEIDTNNTYGIPYMELSTGIAYNPEKVAEVLGPDYKIDSWEILYNDEAMQKLASCGVTSLDSPSDMLCTTLLYMGKDLESKKAEDYNAAGELLKVMGKNVRYFHNSKYINDLASGEVCFSVGWSGDAQLASMRSQEAGYGKIEYVIPKEGALLGYDMMAIPRDAKHVHNAHLFLNYLMRPDVIAKISDYIHYANVNKDATKLMDQSIVSNHSVYFNDDMLNRMHIVVPPFEVTRHMTRVWNQVIIASGNN